MTPSTTFLSRDFVLAGTMPPSSSSSGLHKQVTEGNFLQQSYNSNSHLNGLMPPSLQTTAHKAASNPSRLEPGMGNNAVSYFLNVKTPSPAAFPILFSPAGLPSQPIAPPPLTHDYFNFASHIEDLHDSGPNYLHSGGMDVPKYGISSPLAQTGFLFHSNGQDDGATTAVSSDVQGHFPTRTASNASELTSLSTVTSSSDLLTYSPGSSPSTSSQSSHELVEHVPYMTQEDFLFLSPQQNLILQEAHQEAQRRAAAFPMSPEMPNLDHNLYHTMPNILQPAPHGSASLPPPHQNITSSPTQTLYSDFDNDSHSSAVFSRPVTSDGMQSMTSPPRMPINLPMAGLAISPTAGEAHLPNHYHNSMHVAINHPKQATHHSPIQPSPASFRVAAANKPKQLGSFPADEAFASSLDQLKDVPADKKPPYLWWTLIRAAILGSPESKLQMDALCAAISEKFPYFGTAKEAKNWKSSIRSVIHTKPCFYKTEDRSGAVWWEVDVNIDPREQRRGMKKRSNSGESGKLEAMMGSLQHNASGIGLTSPRRGSQTYSGDEEEVSDDDASDLYIMGSHGNARKRRKTN